MDYNKISLDMKNVLVTAQQKAKKYKFDEINVMIMFNSVLSIDDCEGYHMLEIWANANNINLDDLKKSIDIILEKNAKRKTQVPDRPTMSQEVKLLLDTADQEAKKLGITVWGSDFFILAVTIEMEDFFDCNGLGYSLNANDLREIISGRLVGGGNVNPDGEEDNEEEDDELKSTSELKKYSIDLTQKAKDGQIDPLIGREVETERLIQVLNRKTKNNPILIGEPGVGKTAIVEGFVQKMYELNSELKIYQLNLTNLVAGTIYRGQFEERMRKIVKEMVGNKDKIIVFIDEFHTLVGAGNGEGALEASNILKPYLARGEIKLIGATTINEYRKYIEKDAALERRLQPIMVEEPTETQTAVILEGSKSIYEKYHNVEITEEAVNLCVSLSMKYISERFLPDKAFDVLDEACSKVKIKHTKELENKLFKLKKEKIDIEEEKEKLTENNKIEDVRNLIEKLKKINSSIDKINNEIEEKKKNKPLVTKTDIADVVSQITNIDAKTLNEDEVDRLFKMETELKKRVKGQDEAIDTISKAIRRWRSGITDPKKPIGCFMFLGPTGVGKTELCKALAEYLFGKEDSLIKIDMSEYTTNYDVAKLIGSSVGLVFSDDGGILTNAVRRKPYSVVVLDEIEKAHKDVYNIFLQIMQDGTLTDGRNRKTSFRNAIVIFTSNIGAKQMLNAGKSFGFATLTSDEEKEKVSKDEIERVVKKAVENEFTPEFINRLDKQVVFNQLNDSLLLEITDMKIQKLAERMKIEIELTDESRKAIVEWEKKPEFGARPIIRSISENLETPISELVLRKKITAGDNNKLIIDYINGKFTFEVLEKSREH